MSEVLRDIKVYEKKIPVNSRLHLPFVNELSTMLTRCQVWIYAVTRTTTRTATHTATYTATHCVTHTDSLQNLDVSMGMTHF